GHQGRLLRYGALCGAMSVVAKLGAEDANEFVIARDGIARLAEELQRRAYDKLGGPPGLSSLSGLKDPVVSKTKGAPRKGKELHPGSEGDMLMKQRRCTTCGVPGHTKRTCTSQQDHGVAGTDGCAVHSSAERSSAKPSAPYAAGRTQDADNDEGIHSENGDNTHNVPDRAVTTSTQSMHVCSHAYCSPHMGVGGGGSNIFLGGKHIEQFFSSQGYSGHVGGSHGVPASSGAFNPTRPTNEDLFEKWVTQEDCKQQVNGFRDCEFKGFPNADDALHAMKVRSGQRTRLEVGCRRSRNDSTLKGKALTGDTWGADFVITEDMKVYLIQVCSQLRLDYPVFTR
ncbi:hypothetical protein S245_037572, partial [Arachis hypogaea]